MKLQELFPNTIDITKEIYEAFDRVLQYKKITSEKHKSISVDVYEIEKTHPIIKVQITTQIIDERTISEVSFFTDEFRFEVLNTTSTGTALSIIATVVDICKKYVNDVDIWFFTAKITTGDEANKKEVKSKSILYGRIARRVADEYNLSMQSMAAKGDTSFILWQLKLGDISNKDVISYYTKWSSNLQHFY